MMGVGSMLAGGWRLIRTQPTAVAVWSAAALVLTVASGLAAQPWGAATIEMQRAMLAQPNAAPQLPDGLWGAILLLDLLALVFYVAIFAAAVRAVALGGSDRFFFLRLGMDELRLVGLGIVLWLLGTALMLVALFALVLVGVVAAFAVGPGAMAGFLIVGYLLAFAALLWAEVRVSLAGAYTVLRRRIVVREAWRATRGRFWTLFTAYLIMTLVGSALMILLILIFSPEIVRAYTAAVSGQSPGELIAAQQALMADPFAPRRIALMLVAAGVLGGGMAFASGAVATAAIDLDRSGGED